MHFNRRAVSQYPFHGTFFTQRVVMPIDGDFLKEENHTTEEVLLETQCDIQQSYEGLKDGTIFADYNVYFPKEKGDVFNINLGDMFRCSKENYGIAIYGKVVGLAFSELGGAVAKIKMSDI